MFRCSYIVAASYPDLIIGDRQTNQLLWRIPDDMRRFREITMNGAKGCLGQSEPSESRSAFMDGVVIMGRRTFDSLPGRKPLKGRVNIVLTRANTGVYNGISNSNSDSDGSNLHFCTMTNVFDIVALYPGKKVFIIGGEEIYRLFWDYCERVYITFVDFHTENDERFARFPLGPLKLPDRQIFEDAEICKVYNGIRYVFMTMELSKED